MREYIVSLKEGVNYDQFWHEIENDSTPSIYVPDRSVGIVNERPGSQRSCHYLLSDEEANQLKNDPRVYSVEIPPEQRDDIRISLKARQSSTFNKSGASGVNWGLYRTIYTSDPFGGNSTAIVNDIYTYNLDGTGVDVVIQDSGLQVDHPEFTDAAGVSRVQQINWYHAAGNVIAGTQSVNHYRDYDGHGTHVAGTAVGKTFGFAKNARIYSMKVSGLEGTGDSGTGISVTDCFDLIKLWHLNKPVDPKTGLKRPTIVNMSWGFIHQMGTVQGGNYRGMGWMGGRDTTKGMIFADYGSGVYVHGARVGSVDTDLEELLSAGVIVVVAAGNYSQKIDVVGGIDYDNYYSDGVLNYYHRGSSPMGAEAIVVGNLSNNLFNGIERKNTSSECGPRVDVYAPGSLIMSTASNTYSTSFNSVVSNYYANQSYKQMYISGTSMASPQVAGICALLAQVYPHATSAQMRALIKSKATKNLLLEDGLDNNYGNLLITQGSPNNLLYHPFPQETSMTTTGSFTVSGTSIGV